MTRVTVEALVAAIATRTLGSARTLVFIVHIPCRPVPGVRDGSSGAFRSIGGEFDLRVNGESVARPSRPDCVALEPENPVPVVRCERGRHLHGLTCSPPSFNGAEQLIEVVLQRLSPSHDCPAPMNQSARRVVPLRIGTVEQIGIPQHRTVIPHRAGGELRPNGRGGRRIPPADRFGFIPTMHDSPKPFP